MGDRLTATKLGSVDDIPIAGHVKLLVVLVLLDALQHRSVRHTHRLHQRRQVL